MNNLNGSVLDISEYDKERATLPSQTQTGILLSELRSLVAGVRNVRALLGMTLIEAGTHV